MPPGSFSISLPFGNSYVFVIGVDKYQYVEPLQTAVADAKAISKVLREKHAYTIHTALLDESATKAQILSLIQDTIPNLLKEKDRAIFYFAGHGIAYNSEGDPQGYLVPVDGRLEETTTLISMDELNAAMDKWSGRHGLLILDCCFAGAFRWSLSTRAGRRRAPKVVYEQRFMRYAQDKAWQVLASAGADQEAIDLLHRLIGARATEGHSPFATALLEGLQGLADFGVIEGKQDGLVTATELYVYLRDRVNQMTSNSLIRQTPALFNLSRHDKGEFLFLNPNSPLNLPPFPERNPYVGLRSYSAEDRLYFHGRDKVLDRLLQKCLTEPLVVVTGGSGVGKSSLLAAGLVPQLEEMGWKVLPIFSPGRDPLSKLESEMPDWKDQLRSGNIVWIIDQYEECLSAGLSSPLWQDFERELAEIIEDEVSSRKDGRLASLLIVIGIRSDYDLLLQTQPHPLDPAEGQWWKKGRFLIPYFSREDLLEVIMQPADQAVLFFEPASFPFTLANELDGLPGALPLLSLSLSTLYDKFVASNRTDRTLLGEEYWSLGGIAGILSSRADSVIEQLTDLQPIVKKILIRMIQVENGQLTGRRVAYLPAGLSNNDNRKLIDELDYPGEKAKQEVEQVVQILINEQLIVLTSDQQGQSYLEPVHDALILFWPRCRQWIEEEGMERLIVHRSLWEVVKEYSTVVPSSIRERRPSTIPTPTLLWDNNPHLSNLHGELSNEDHSFNQLEKNFLERSMQERMNEIERLERLNEQITQQRDEALRQKEEAERKGREIQSLAFAQLAKAEMERDTIMAFYLTHASYESIQSDPPPLFAIRTLLDVAYHCLPFWPVQRTYKEPPSTDSVPLRQYGAFIKIFNKNWYEGLVNSQAERFPEVSTLDPLGRFESFQTDQGFVIRDSKNQLRRELGPKVKPRWSPDGAYCLLLDPGGVTYFFRTGISLDDWEEEWKKEGMENAYFFPENQVLCQSAGDNSIQLLSKNGNLIKSLDEGLFGDFSPDENNLVIVDGKDFQKLTEEVFSGVKFVQQAVGAEKLMAEIGFSPDGRLVYTHSRNAMVTLWEFNTEQELHFCLEASESYHPSFSPDSRFFLTNRLDSTTVWDTHGANRSFLENKIEKDSAEVLSISGMQIMRDLVSEDMALQSPIRLPQFFPDSRYLLLNKTPSRLKLIDLYTGSQANFHDHNTERYSSFLTSDSRFAYVSSSSGGLEKWRLHDPFQVKVGGGRNRFQQLKFVKDAGLLSGVHSDNVIGFYRLDGTPLVEVMLTAGVLWQVRFSPNGRFVIAFQGDNTSMWYRNGEQLDLLDVRLGVVGDIVFSEDSSLLLVVAANFAGTLWRWEEEQWLKVSDSYRDLKDARFSPTGELIYSMVSTSKVELWNLNGQMLDHLVFFGEKTNSQNGDNELFVISIVDDSWPGPEVTDYQFIEFFHQDQFALTVSKFGSLRCWQLNKVYDEPEGMAKRELLEVEAVLLDLSMEERQYTKFKLSSDRRTLLVYTAEGTEYQRISLDGFFETEPILELPSTSFSKDSRQASFGFSPGSVYQYNLYDNCELKLERLDDSTKTFINLFPDFRPVQIGYVPFVPIEYSPTHWLEISPDNKYLFVQLGRKQGASLWDIEGNKLIDLEEKGSSIVEASFSIDSRYLLTLTEDGIATLFPLPDTVHEILSTPNYLPELTSRQKEKAGLS